MQLRNSPFKFQDALNLMENSSQREVLREFNLAPKVSQKAKSVKAMAEALGFDVIRCRLPRKVTGQLVHDAFAENGYRIEVNETASVEAQRWAVLHEIGHFYRHSERDNPFDDERNFDPSGDTFYLDPKEEREANEFASAVLFGNGIFEGAAELHGRNIDRLARQFGVSRKTIEVELDKL